MMYELPTSLEIGGKAYEIESDYRAILDICVAICDPELNNQERAMVALQIFYPDFDCVPASDYQEALERCFWFINCGEAPSDRQTPKLMDWEQDFPRIVSPINRVLGVEIRAVEYLHWWSFISAYYEIGDCLFAQIVAIRNKMAKGKPLDKQEREFYRQNRDIVDLKTKYSTAEEDLLKEWI